MYVSEAYENLQVEGRWPNGEPWEEQENNFYSAVILYGREVERIKAAQREASRGK